MTVNKLSTSLTANTIIWRRLPLRLPICQSPTTVLFKTSLTQMIKTVSSVLTRILPWGVPGPPLLKNRGPVRTLGGQSYSKWSVTWSTYLIQYGRQGVYDSIMMHTPIFTTYVGTTKLRAITLNLLITCFIHLNKQTEGVLGWPLKLPQSPYSKVCLTSSLPLCPKWRIFLAFNAPSQFFLWESRKAAA